MNCKKIVKDPKECKECSGLVCSGCVEEFTKEWRTIFSRGSYGNIGEQHSFNNEYWRAIDESNYPMPIIKREAKNATVASHKVIYFKRKTDPRLFDAYQYLIVTWSTKNNKLHEDFDIYSTFEDALDDRNPW